MAVRTPTNPPWKGGVSDLTSNQRIITTPVSRTTDDQQYIVDRSTLVMADVFRPVLVTADSWTVVRRYYPRDLDRCGLDTQEPIHVAIYAWCTPAVPTGNCDFSVGIYDALSAADYVGTSVTGATRSDHLWRGWIDTVEFYVDDTFMSDGLIVAAKRDSDAAPRGVYVAGVAVYSD